MGSSHPIHPNHPNHQRVVKQLFVDTSAWDALADKADKDYPSAIRFRNEIAGRRKLLTSNYILDELQRSYRQRV
jgi:predicted nucleic acid-binding protein